MLRPEERLIFRNLDQLCASSSEYRNEVVTPIKT